MPTRRDVPEGSNDALLAKDILDAMNAGLIDARTALNLYRKSVNAPDETTATSTAFNEMLASSTPANFNSLADDAARLELLRRNQREILFLLRELLAVVNAYNAWFTQVRGALAKVLRFIRRSGE
jgi:hypothetical protein